MSGRRRRERQEDRPVPRADTATAEQFVEDVRKTFGGTWRGRAYVPCCILCGSSRVVMGGVWSPTPEVQAKLLVPTDKFRLIGYCACAKCARLPDLMTRVEEHVLADFAAMAASPTCN